VKQFALCIASFRVRSRNNRIWVELVSNLTLDNNAFMRLLGYTLR
jgi:hypothetical protein